MITVNSSPPILTRRLLALIGSAHSIGTIALLIRVLGALPFLGILVGACFFNRVTPLILGLPLLLAWLLLWLLLTSAIMALVYWLDPANKTDAGEGRPT